jgi:protocatechuate 3,4-dioxygenase beta subunit
MLICTRYQEGQVKGVRVSRREIFERCIVKGFLIAGIPMSSSNLLALWQKSEQEAVKPTPEEVLGPFFKKHAPNAKNLRVPGDQGVPLVVTGNILNTRGEPVTGARVDIWQADHHGRYDVQGYRYRTKLELDSVSKYEIDTVMPGHYSDRPAQHIHYLISAPGHKTLITQLYFATDPYFEGDPERKYDKGGIVGNRELIRPVMLFEQGQTPHTAVNFDLILEKA